jgi:uncharacterized membrane protein
MHWLRRAFIGAATVWPMALLLAPFAASRPHASNIVYGFAFVLYAAGSLICHQRPERSFHLFGTQLPVCARCMGIYAGAAVAACLLWMRTVQARHEADTVVAQDFSPAPRAVLLVSAIPTAATLLYEWTTGEAPGNWTRALSGASLGAAVAWIVSAVR